MKTGGILPKPPDSSTTGSKSREREQGPVPHGNIGLRVFREAWHSGDSEDAERRDEEDHGQGEGRQRSENHRHDDDRGGQRDQLALRGQTEGGVALPVLEDRAEESGSSQPLVQTGRRAGQVVARRQQERNG